MIALVTTWRRVLIATISVVALALIGVADTRMGILFSPTLILLTAMFAGVRTPERLVLRIHERRRRRLAGRLRRSSNTFSRPTTVSLALESVIASGHATRPPPASFAV